VKEKSRITQERRGVIAGGKAAGREERQITLGSHTKTTDRSREGSPAQKQRGGTSLGTAKRRQLEGQGTPRGRGKDRNRKQERTSGAKKCGERDPKTKGGHERDRMAFRNVFEKL